jgi:hypothetical protein
MIFAAVTSDGKARARGACFSNCGSARRTRSKPDHGGVLALPRPAARAPRAPRRGALRAHAGLARAFAPRHGWCAGRGLPSACRHRVAHGAVRHRARAASPATPTSAPTRRAPLWAGATPHDPGRSPGPRRACHHPAIILAPPLPRPPREGRLALLSLRRRRRGGARRRRRRPRRRRWRCGASALPRTRPGQNRAPAISLHLPFVISIARAPCLRIRAGVRTRRRRAGRSAGVPRRAGRTPRSPRGSRTPRWARRPAAGTACHRHRAIAD